MNCGEQRVRDIVERNAQVYGDADAYIYRGVRHSWVDFARDVKLAARMLLGMGVRRASHVGFWGLNSYAWVVCLMACLEIGACCVLANYSCRRDEMAHLARYGKVEYLLVGELKDGIDAREVTEFLMKECGVRQSASMDRVVSGLEGRMADECVFGKACDDASLDDAAYIIFTSGTTKRPKGVVMSQRSVLRMTATIAQKIGLSQRDVQVVALAMFHGSGVNACVMPALHAGACSVILECFSSMKVLEAIQTYRCTVFNSVPSLVLLMTRHKEFPTFDLSSLRCGIWSGGSVAGEQFERIQGCLANMKVVMAYGQTEATSLSTMTDIDEAESLRSGMCGKPLEGIELRIADVESGAVLPAGEVGEIQIGGYSIMEGYFELPEENAKALTEDGWLKTGDLGRVDEGGELWFVGRADDMIVRAGENISPAEIESAIAGYSPAIEQVKVVGVRSDLLGQEVAAFFTASESVDEGALKRRLACVLAKFKIPVYLRQLNEMPQTSSGKIDKKAIVKMADEMAHCAQ